MCAFLVIILLAFSAQANAENAENFDRQINTLAGQSVREGKSLVDLDLDLDLDEWVDNFGGLFHRAQASSYHHFDEDLDHATIAKGSSQSLGGQVIGDGKYLLQGGIKTTSGKSKFYFGYRSEKGQPVGDKLAIKISRDRENMDRESANYDKIASGLFPGRFVKKFDYFPDRLNTQVMSDFDQQGAIVLELGLADLKAVIAQRGGGLDPKTLRKAAKAAAECLQAMQTTGYVWTDLKPQNFVLVGDGVKGIDIESAMPQKSNPIDYTPEACPPEFARAFIVDGGESFVLDYSYDIWSYGMYLYELATGKGYFGGTRDGGRIFQILAAEDFEVDVSDVEDSKLRNLIEQCLTIDPKKRPGIVQILTNPYLIEFLFPR